MLWRGEPDNRLEGGMFEEDLLPNWNFAAAGSGPAASAGLISGRKINPEFCSLPRFTFHVNHAPM